MEATVFNPAQQHILQMMSYIKTDESLNDLEHALASYFAKKVDDDIDRLWADGAITADTIEEWGKEHMRTSYKIT